MTWDGEAEHVERVTVHVFLSEHGAAGSPGSERLQPVRVAMLGHPDVAFENSPPRRKESEDLIELAVGDNLFGVRATEPPPDVGAELWVEKSEVRGSYS